MPFPNDQLLTGYPVVVGIQVVGVRAVLRKFPLRFSVGGEVGTIQITATALSTTATVVGKVLACFSVVIRVEVVGIARVALELCLGFPLGGEVGAIKLPVSAPSSATSKLLARDAVIIRIQPVWIARIRMTPPPGYSRRCGTSRWTTRARRRSSRSGRHR
jgi:hypothetical protein